MDKCHSFGSANGETYVNDVFDRTSPDSSFTTTTTATTDVEKEMAVAASSSTKRCRHIRLTHVVFSIINSRQPSSHVNPTSPIYVIVAAEDDDRIERRRRPAAHDHFDRNAKPFAAREEACRRHLVLGVVVV